MATAEEIRNAARAKAGLAEAQTNTAKTAAAKAAAAAKAKAAADAAAKTKADLAAQAAKDKAAADTAAAAEAERLRNRLIIDDTEDRVDSIAYLQDLFAQYGLASLANTIVDLKQQGLTDRLVSIKLKETPEFKQRFVGNENRKKAGLQPLTPAEYISAEAAYKKVMRDSQLPAGFYDQPDDFAKFLGNDVSPSELQQRVDIANQSIQNADKFYTDSLRTYYGLNTGDMLAYALDPERALPFITRQQKTAQLGAEAARQGLNIGVATAESLEKLGVSAEQARTGFETVAEIAPIAQKLSQITAAESKPIGLEETTTAVFGGTQSAEYKQRLKKLAEIEQSRFSGQAGVGRGSLSRGMSGQI